MTSALLFGLALFSAQSTDDRLGLTNAQIVAMGYEAWRAKFSEERGDSTASTNIGNTVFRDALVEHNNQIIGSLSTGDQSFLAPLRKDLDETTSDVVEAGYVMTGGGTIWSNIQTGQHVHNEQTISKIVTRRYSSRASQADVWAAYQAMNLKFERMISDADRYDPVPVPRIEESRRHLLACRERFFAVLPALSRQPVGARREVFAVYVQNFQMISLMGE